ncbi:MAG TPA: alpha/beta hydrolase [Acidimicrobiales bacterium]|nr:alpha/beta hydrolase [Acidimicrobiales bacterium]
MTKARDSRLAGTSDREQARATSMVPSTDEVTLALHEFGDDIDRSKTIVLVCHANGLCALAYEPFARSLGEELRPVAVDFRGHGSSTSRSELDFAWSGFAHDVEAVLDALAGEVATPDRFTVHGVGHSMGGAALLLAAARRPDAFASLWMFEPIVPPPMRPMRQGASNPVADQAERRRTDFSSYEEAISNFASKPPLNELDPEALRGYVVGGFAPTETGVTLRCRPEWEAAIFRNALSNGVWDVLQSVTVPVLVAAGRQGSEMHPASFAKATVEKLPRAILENHEDLGHFGPLEDPRTMAGSVRDWIATHDPN